MNLNRHRIDRISDEKIIVALQEVAKHYDYVYFSRHEFDKVSKNCKGSVVISRFGNWKDALSKTGIKFKKKPYRNRYFISNVELMLEMAKIIDKLGHRPSKIEWESLKPKYSYTTYKTRYKGWVNAWRYFFENFKMIDLSSENIGDNVSNSNVKPCTIMPEDIRSIPLKLRLKVLQRDNFKCVFCGASPANQSNIQLHIDHIKPFSEGGKTEYNNLQTLCQNCNWGKGND
ncbi:MAG: HNH endonuclease [Phycisphaerae bacterium]|nr:HNH endonuclease [Phycisphaerae bacterium]